MTLSYENSDDWVRVTLNGQGDTAAKLQYPGGTPGAMRPTTSKTSPGLLYDDDLTGDEGHNVLKGLAGDDTIDRRDGNDTLEGGAGAKTIWMAVIPWKST